MRNEYFVTVDADTRLETSALAAIVGRIAATGAGCVAGNLVSAGARTWVQKMQFWDYFVNIAAIKRYQGSYGATLVAQGAFSAWGFLLFVLVFQVVQSACSLWGYAAALTRRGIDWKR